MKRRFFLLISSLFLVFVSCKGVLQEPTLMGESKTVTVSGTLTLPNEFNEAKNVTLVATPRTALPSIPPVATYTVSATDGTTTINGTVDTSANPPTYEIALTEGSWTLTASGKDASNNVILSGTASITILSGTSSPTPITLSMNKTSGTGSINLSVKASATKITNATAKFTSISGGTAISDVQLDFYSLSDREQTISVPNVAVGSYEIAISFFDVHNVLLYFCTDAVNVFENLETNTWKDSGEFVDSSGNFDVTESLVTKFARSTFYVASSTATPAGNDTTGNGSYFAPFASMQKAFETVFTANDSTSEYKIFVDGTITGTNAQLVTDSAVSNPLNLTIEPMVGQNATLDMQGISSSDAFIHLRKNNLTLTLKNLTLTGGNYNLGGAIFAGEGNVIIDSCIISGNTAKTSNNLAIGGGVCACGGIVTLKGNTVIKNNEADEGSGVYFDGGTLNIQDSVQIGGAGDTKNNDVYLDLGISFFITVTVTGALSNDAYINITPYIAPGSSEPTAGTVVVQAGTGYTLTDADLAKFHVLPESLNMEVALETTGDNAGKGVLKSSVINIDGTQLATVKNAPTKTEYEVGTDKADVDLTGLVVTLALQGGGSVDLSYADHPACFEVVDFVDINKSNSSNTVTTESKYLDIAISWADTITINGKKYANGDMEICNSVEITAKTPITDYYVSSTGSDTNNGTTSTTPFATMNQAITTILQANNGSSIYTIHVKGEITGDNAKVSLTSANVTRSLKLTIQGTNKDNDKLNRNLTSSAPDGMVMHLNCSNLTLTIKNLTITGGNKDLMGGGLFIESGDITINNCEISRNTSPTGSGMSITNDATVTLTGTTNIRNNSGTTGLGVSLSQTATLKVQDGVTIAGGMTDNDLYLQNGAFVTVLGELNSSASINITLETPTSGTVVVKGGLGHAPTQGDLDRIHVLNATSGMSLYLSLGMGVLGTPPQNVSVNDLSTLQMQPGGSYSVSGNISDSDLATLFSNLDTVQGDAVILDLSGCTSSTTPLVISGNNLRGNVKEITFPNVEIEIQGNAFQGNQTIEKVTIPNATSIPQGSFSACPNLSQVNLGNITGPIGDNCFSQCTSLQSIEIPSGVTSLGAQAFSGCTSLQTVQIDGNTVTSISEGCFAQCTSLSSITIPEGVTSLGTNAFQGCTSLTEVHLPDSMAVANAIGEQAFSGCQHQCDIYVPFTDVTVLQATWGIQWFDMANGNYTLHTKTP